MDAKSILEVKKLYQAREITRIDVGLFLVTEGCNSGETESLITTWDAEPECVLHFGCDPDSREDRHPFGAYEQKSHIYSSREEFEEDEEMLDEIHHDEVLAIMATLPVEKQQQLEAFMYMEEGTSEDYLLRYTQELHHERSDDCVCSDQAFSVYGCMCRVRRMPG